ncbi:TIGR03943 family putative permease subunit [Streptomyces sp. NPDC101152]|uniref:TIGR03943 family putative permease subunit n=1 Tax=Streptomyces sp. NPDC101152 TaxID=3366116 RepID=UPI0037F2ED21
MSRHARTLLLAVLGAGLLHVSLLTDLYLRYVKEGLRLPLIACGAVLLLLALAGAVRDRSHGGDADHAHGHDHSRTPRVAWLLFLPALSLLLYVPPALGAYTATRTNNKAITVRKGFDPLPATSPLPMTLTDFTSRVQQDAAGAIRHRSVQMTGFVTPAGHGEGWFLTRIIFTCCAADSQSVKVRMYGGAAQPANTWLAVTGTWHPRGRLGTRTAEAALDVGVMRRITPPVNAYTDDLPLTPS